MGIEYITAAKDAILGVAGIVGAVVAWRGLSTWNRQLRGAADFEAARSLARVTYKLQHALQSARTPLVTGDEFPPGYRGDEESTGEEQRGAWAHVYNARWAPIWSALEEFDAARLEGEALWGPEAREVTDKLRRCAIELRVATDAGLDDAATKGRNFREDKEFALSMRRTVHGVADDSENPFNQKLDDAVKGIEALLRPHLKRA